MYCVLYLKDTLWQKYSTVSASFVCLILSVLIKNNKVSRINACNIRKLKCIVAHSIRLGGIVANDIWLLFARDSYIEIQMKNSLAIYLI